MNIATQPETPPPWDGNRVAAGYVTNRDKLDDEVEKYRHLEELAELFDDPRNRLQSADAITGAVLLAADARND
jgi:hypothetical protein